MKGFWWLQYNKAKTNFVQCREHQ